MHVATGARKSRIESVEVMTFSTVIMRMSKNSVVIKILELLMKVVSRRRMPKFRLEL